MELLALLLGCGLGFGLAYALIGLVLFKLHDNGNSTGGFYDFSRIPLSVLSRQDKIK